MVLRLALSKLGARRSRGAPKLLLTSLFPRAYRRVRFRPRDLRYKNSRPFGRFLLRFNSSFGSFKYDPARIAPAFAVVENIGVSGNCPH